MPLPEHDHTPIDIPPYSLTDTWHAEWDKFADLNQTAAPVSPNMPRDNTTVPLDIQRMTRRACALSNAPLPHLLCLILRRCRQTALPSPSPIGTSGWSWTR